MRQLNAFFVWLLFAPLWCSAATVSLVASNTVVSQGQQFSVDLVVAGLPATQVVAAYDLDLSFNSSVLGVSSVSFLPALGADGIDQFSDWVSSAGRVDLAAVSLLDEAGLAALQLGSFVIATLVFDTLGVGASDIRFDLLTFPGLLFSNAAGESLAVMVGSETTVRVDATHGTVPEPSTLWLLTLAGVCAASLRHKGHGRRH